MLAAALERLVDRLARRQTARPACAWRGRRPCGSAARHLSRSGASARPPTRSRLWVETSLPVISRPQAAALTNSDGLCPRCEPQSPLPILSRISASAVSGSGMRSSASARHIKSDTLLAGQRKFVQQRIHAEGSRVLPTHGADQVARVRLCLAAARRRPMHPRQQFAHALRLVLPVRGSDRSTQRRLWSKELGLKSNNHVKVSDCSRNRRSFVIREV